MAAYTLERLTFTYPARSAPALREVSLSLAAGDFAVVCGPSGGGKTTLLRHLKPVLAPHGRRSGRVLLDGRPLAGLDAGDQARRIGFVGQNPDNQLVTDKVWHELAFGLESLGYPNQAIRLRVAEMASFFGLQNWFERDVAELSGGQKQLLNLASAMALQPSALILDEPTGQLDPIAAAGFLAAVKKANLELGATVVLSEHRLEQALPLADQLVVLRAGQVAWAGPPGQVCAQAAAEAAEADLLAGLPTAVRVYAGLRDLAPAGACPLSVRDGRRFLDAALGAPPGPAAGPAAGAAGGAAAGGEAGAAPGPARGPARRAAAGAAAGPAAGPAAGAAAGGEAGAAPDPARGPAKRAAADPAAGAAPDPAAGAAPDPARGPAKRA
ncbi:MAG: energy-coupling factor ABC transporter ATP-binding protein, partial [Bifidobacteriaceae bacterium]|nr:energy-coupling factor ABC transporter ATP-binding protein [Bifidobacteriaceae bacterium]